MSNESVEGREERGVSVDGASADRLRAEAKLAAIPCRPDHKRKPPLTERHGAVVRYVAGEYGGEVSVYAAPGYKVFIERMWHGDYQQIPVDPVELDDVIAALENAKRYLGMVPVHPEAVPDAS